MQKQHRHSMECDIISHHCNMAMCKNLEAADDIQPIQLAHSRP